MADTRPGNTDQRYCPKSTLIKIKIRKMKNISKSILVFSISVLFCSKSFSQESGIKIGETCPDVVLSHIINFKTDHARISDFKGKLLILDF